MSTIVIIEPGDTVELDPASSGLAHGYGIFETMRVRSGRLELWDSHWDRLTASAASLLIDCPFCKEDVLDAVVSLGRKLPADVLIKISLLREKGSSRLMVYSRPLSTLPDEIGLHLGQFAPVNQYSMLAGHKTHNYVENLLVLNEAHKAGCYDGLRLNLDGQIAEGAISNLFFYRKGAWHTPHVNSGLLPGVMRGLLLSLILVEEGNYELKDLIEAEAVFLTNAGVGLLHVDWLLDEGRKRPFMSSDHACYRMVARLLEERVEAASIQVS